ncbi:MAG: protein-L-isoaspartate(D-aspartate) O-methyltransferase [Planctomycetia bacterium]
MSWQTDRDQLLRDLHLQGITDEQVTAAMASIDRQRFVPPELRPRAYENRPLPIGDDQTISQPYIVALMLQALELKPEHRVLEIGTGSGYQTALLANLAKQVYTVERIRILSQRARAAIDQLNLANVDFRTGDGRDGWPDDAPFDRIIVGAGAERLPAALLDQLGRDGVLVAPIGPPERQKLVVLRDRDGTVETTSLSACRFVPLLPGVEPGAALGGTVRPRSEEKPVDLDDDPTEEVG